MRNHAKTYWCNQQYFLFCHSCFDYNLIIYLQGNPSQRYNSFLAIINLMLSGLTQKIDQLSYAVLNNSGFV